jgi:hypothetical protein
MTRPLVVIAWLTVIVGTIVAWNGAVGMVSAIVLSVREPHHSGVASFIRFIIAVPITLGAYRYATRASHRVWR